MQNWININQAKAAEWNLSLSEAFVVAFMANLPTWADTVVIDSRPYYFASRFKALEEIPMVSDKPDTIYRIYKSLEEKELIKHIKIGEKDYISFLGKFSEWNRIIRDSEKNPSELGKKSESDSEKNPTYTINNNLSEKPDIKNVLSENFSEKTDESSKSPEIIQTWMREQFEKNHHVIQFLQNYTRAKPERIKLIPEFIFENYFKHTDMAPTHLLNDYKKFVEFRERDAKFNKNPEPQKTHTKPIEKPILNRRNL